MKNFFLNQLFLVLAALIITTFSLRANVKLPLIFSSNMVLQKGVANTIWGWADKSENVGISLNGKVIKTKAEKDGKWSAKLPVMDYGGPYTLKVKGKNLIEMNNVMIGEVWLCSGQSNMQFPVSLTDNAKEEIANATYPNIRLFSVPREMAQFPLDQLEKGEWSSCSPETVSDFSAVGYFFGRKIHQDLHVAVGLINASWGGTTAETWISSETIKKDTDFLEKWNDLQKMEWTNNTSPEKIHINKILGEIPLKDNGIKLGFNQAKFDDSGWKTVQSPMLWEKQGYVALDGVAWYRKSFELTKEQASSNLQLSLAKIDDIDTCWVNGVAVGNSGKSYIERKYEVPASILKEGKNVIAIKITDTGGYGGIYGKNDELFALAGDTKISLSGDWKIKFSEVVIRNATANPNDYPTLLFNGMINPIIPYGIEGVIWYQGESNAYRAAQYQRLFPSLITDWRNHWKIGDFSFIWVQLANFMKPAQQPSESKWAELREAQTMTLKLPNTGMASAIDIGDANDIHPRNKQEVGRRLALNALKVTYGKDMVSQGPMYSSVEFKNSKAIISFTNTGSGLMVKDPYGYVKGFAIAGADKKFYWAPARIIGNNQVEVISEEVPVPSAVRYGWADNPHDVNLYNREGLPANPFRTDN